MSILRNGCVALSNLRVKGPWNGQHERRLRADLLPPTTSIIYVQVMSKWLPRNSLGEERESCGRGVWSQSREKREQGKPRYRLLIADDICHMSERRDDMKVGQARDQLLLG